MARSRYINSPNYYVNPIRHDKRGHQIIKIAYGAVPNANKVGGGAGGFVPVIWENGRSHGGFTTRGLDHETACLVAQARALELADKFVGDWNVKITKGCARGTQVDLAHGPKRAKPKAKPKKAKR